MPDPEYRMKISLNVLKHLGIGLYSNIPTVLSEAVANAWDADATNVGITIDYDGGTITIQDDGDGMSVRDANEKYLLVGYERRKATGGAMTKKNRPVMGRKGIGKLSLFSIARTITVQSIRDGNGHGFVMDAEEIKNALENKSDDTYRPKATHAAPDLERGTRITLSNIKPQMRRTAALRKRLARRFSVLDDSFSITLDGKTITPEDRGYQSKLQYVWTFGERGKKATSDSKARRCELDPEVVIDGTAERIDGWIGTANESGRLKEDGESINRIVVLVRGKVAQEDILEELGESGLYGNYLLGEIHADFLDSTELPDIMTTNRQRIKEDDDDPRYAALREKVRGAVKTIQSEWTDLRNADGEKTALEIPQIKEWYGDLTDGKRRLAKRLFGSIYRLPLGYESDRRPLLISGVLAFESLEIRDMLDKLERVDVGSLEMLRDVFLRMDDLEATAYYRTIKTRLSMIEKLKEITDNDALERVVQEHIFEHLWLVDPSWEHVPGTGRMEKRIGSAFDSLNNNLGEEEKRSRVDIKYTALRGMHVIVELKRPGYVPSTEELLAQVRRYGSAARSMLEQDGRDETVNFVCVIGKEPRDWTNAAEKERSVKSLEVYGARVVFYNDLIDNAEKAYDEYIRRGQKVSRLFDLISKIEQKDKDALIPADSTSGV